MHRIAEPSKMAGRLPDRSGVYVFKDDRGSVLYVGKAISLRKRVRSYFSTRKQETKTKALVSRIASLDFYVTVSETEALLLEQNLIKRYRPPYNVAYRDDKSYPYIAVSTGEDFPRVRYTRERRRPGVRYFGPYASARSAKETLEALLRIFPIRSCSQTIFSKARGSSTPCLYYHIGRCAAPCVGKIDEESYRRLTRQIVAFLEGRQEQVIDDLTAQMKEASSHLAFEKAAVLRDRISFAQRLKEQQRVAADQKISEDAVALAIDGDLGYIQVLKVRNGKLIGSEDFVLEVGWESEPREIFASFLKQYYLSPNTDFPKEVLLPWAIGEAKAVETIVRDYAGHKVQLSVPRRGRKFGLVSMVKENAEFALERYQLQSSHQSRQLTEALAEIGKVAGLSVPPALIECYDISNISGTNPVGSMVVFETGQPRPKLYRKFAIKTVKGANDYAMMKEVLSRRLAKLRMDPAGRFSSRPDLVVVDGGRPPPPAAPRGRPPPRP